MLGVDAARAMHIEFSIHTRALAQNQRQPGLQVEQVARHIRAHRLADAVARLIKAETSQRNKRMRGGSSLLRRSIVLGFGFQAYDRLRVD